LKNKVNELNNIIIERDKTIADQAAFITKLMADVNRLEKEDR
jgi:hypothetical protein